MSGHFGALLQAVAVVAVMANGLARFVTSCHRSDVAASGTLFVRGWVAVASHPETVITDRLAGLAITTNAFGVFADTANFLVFLDQRRDCNRYNGDRRRGGVPFFIWFFTSPFPWRNFKTKFCRIAETMFVIIIQLLSVVSWGLLIWRKNFVIEFSAFDRPCHVSSWHDPVSFLQFQPAVRTEPRDQPVHTADHELPLRYARIRDYCHEAPPFFVLKPLLNDKLMNL